MPDVSISQSADPPAPQPSAPANPPRAQTAQPQHPGPKQPVPQRWSIPAFALVGFLLVLGIPYAYDQINLTQYRAAKANGTLVIRDSYPVSAVTASVVCNCSDGQSSDGTANPVLAATSPPRPDPGVSPAASPTRPRAVISHDYVGQMEQAGSLRAGSFAVVAIFATALLVIMIATLTPPKPVYRAALVGGTFLFCFACPLVGFMALQDLPHTNTKFYVVVGIAYAFLLSLSTYLTLLTLPLPAKSTGDAAEQAARLSALQYKHRYWTQVFNLASAGLLSLMITVSFKLFDIYVAVFGEGFVQYPIIGTVIAVGFGILGVLIGVFRPIRRNLRLIEDAMLGAP